MKIMGELAIAIVRANQAGAGTMCLRIACVLLLAAVPAAQAFSLAPITMEFAPSGRGANRAFQVENPSEQTVAVQISMLSRAVDLDGKERNAPAEDDFIVYPSQILLKPQQVQTVRVQWVGTAKPDKELTYRILAEELPIDLTKEQPTDSNTSSNFNANIKVVVRYLGSIYIVPKGAKAEVILDATASETGADGARKLVIVFQNRGTAHALLSGLTLTLQSGGQTVKLGPDDLKGVAGENLLAGNKRRFVVPWPAALPEGPVQSSFDFDNRR
jgi:fimbrial chaperone protein